MRHLLQLQSIQLHIYMPNMHSKGPGSKLTASQLGIKSTAQWPVPLWGPAVRLGERPTCSPGLQDVEGAATGGEPMPVLLLIDTAGCAMEERVEEEGDSKSNDGEAQVCPFNGPDAACMATQRLLAHPSEGRCWIQGLILLHCLKATGSIVSPCCSLHQCQGFSDGCALQATGPGCCPPPHPEQQDAPVTTFAGVTAPVQ